VRKRGEEGKKEYRCQKGFDYTGLWVARGQNESDGGGEDKGEDTRDGGAEERGEDKQSATGFELEGVRGRFNALFNCGAK
jgi:hypothetical protein